VKIHCSVLAEDAIRAAIGDWKKKNSAPAAAVEAEAVAVAG
jgi:nitrogen fixation NifU-like protein